MKQRNISLDIARGLSIFLIVLSHSYCSWSYWFDFFYVQVFFYLSGVFMRPTQNLENSLYKKVRSLLFPYMFFGTICSLLVFVLGRTGIADIHIYDPDSFDNGPQWFLIALFTLTMICLWFNSINKQYFTIWGGILIFAACYILGLLKIDDYTNITKAGISLPFFYAGNFYLRMETNLKKCKYLLFFMGLFLCVIFIWFIPIDIGIRWITLPVNPIWYLLASFGGIGIVLSLSFIFEKTRFLNNILSFWGYNSLFILCLHWPITRILYDKILPNYLRTDIMSIIICIVICCLTSYIGIWLRKWFKGIF